MIVQNILVFLLVGIILFFAFILISSEGFSNANLQSYLSFESLNIYGILKTMVIAPFLFIGFDCIPQISEELTFEPKKASLLAMLAVIIGAMLYIIIMFCTTFGIPKELLINGSINWATGYSIELYFGKIGLLFIVIAFITAVIAGINGFYFASSRLILAMARDGDLPSIFGKVDEKNNTPKNAIILILIISLIAMLVNIVFSFYFSSFMGVKGLAFANAIGMWMNFSLLYFFLSKKFPKTISFVFVLKVIFSTMMMGVVILIFKNYFPFVTTNVVTEFLYLIFVTGLGFLVYLFLGKLLVLEEAKILMRKLKMF
jgi:amino acid transporter